jgi:cytochrome c553
VWGSSLRGHLEETLQRRRYALSRKPDCYTKTIRRCAEFEGGPVVSQSETIFGGGFMKMVSLKLLLHTAIFVMAFSAPGRAEDGSTATVPTREFQAKLLYCKTCHGVEAQGLRGAFPIPRLAGQQPDYIKNQLQAFIQGKRKNAVMFTVAHALSPAMVAGLAEQFKNLNPKPLGGASVALVPEGREIFEKGVPSANIPPCSTCHGSDAKGNGEFPRLAGQLNDYIVDKLTNWTKERGTETSAIMEPIAHGLTPPQIAAVAAYLSTLE